MRKTLYSLLILCAGIGTDAATLAPDWSEAQRIVKQEGRDCIVLLTGTDWDPVSARTVAILKDAAFLNAVGDSVIVQIDHPDNPDSAAKELLERNKEFHYAIYHYPALLAFDKDGQIFGLQTGLTGDAAAMLVRKWRDQRKKRDETLSKVGDLNGEARAEVIGRALDAMEFDVASQHNNLIKELEKADPKDATGYLAKYRLGIFPIAQQVMDGKNLPEAMTKTGKLLENTRLSPIQRQSIYAVRYGILRRNGSSLQDQSRNLRTLIDTDPESDLAIGGRRLLKNMQDKMNYDSAWERYRNAPDDVAAQKAYIAVAAAGDGKLPQLPKARDPLISPLGTFSFSSLDRQYDKSLRHILLPRTEALGQFHSQSEVRPWVQIDLKREYRVSMVAMVNRAGNNGRIPPVVIEASTDDKAWTSLLQDASTKDLYVANCEINPARARYVRIRRDDDRRECYHFSNLLVWGIPADANAQ